jgi:hypothetical protein
MKGSGRESATAITPRTRRIGISCQSWRCNNTRISTRRDGVHVNLGNGVTQLHVDYLLVAYTSRTQFEVRVPSLSEAMSLAFHIERPEHRQIFISHR